MDVPRRVIAAVARMAGTFVGVVALAVALLAFSGHTSRAATIGASVRPSATAPNLGQESPDPETPPSDDPDDDEGDDGVEPPPMEAPPIALPDSLRNKPAVPGPGGGAPVETLLVMPKNVLGKAGTTTVAPPKKKGTPFGLHPAVFFAALIVGHVFVVRAVTD